MSSPTGNGSSAAGKNVQQPVQLPVQPSPEPDSTAPDTAPDTALVPHSGATASPAGSRSRRGLSGPRGAAAAVLLLGATAALASGTVPTTPGGGSGRYAVADTAVPAGDYAAVCPGPPRLLGEETGSADPEFSPVSRSAKTQVGAMVLGDLSGTLPGSALHPLGGGAPVAVLAESTGADAGSGSTDAPASSDASGLTSRTAGVLKGTPVDAPSVFRAEPLAAQTPVAGAMFSYTAGDGDLRGLTAAPCQLASNDAWILGAATTVGSTSVLVLSNPTETPATVDLDFAGSDGPLKTQGSTGILVAPGETEQIVLGGIAPDQEQLAVRVRSSGGRVAAVVQQSVLRGLTPGGVELLTPTAAPAGSQVVPGVAVQDAATARAIQGQAGYETASPALQVLVPGTSDAVLDVTVFGPDGEVPLSGGGVVTAPAGALLAVPLDSLPAGNYTVALTSDVPVSAAVRVSLGAGRGKPVDTGSAVAAARLGADSSVVFAAGADASLVFGSPAGRSEVNVTGIRADGTLGTGRMFSIAGGTSVVVPASALGEGTAAAVISATGDPVFGAQVNTLPKGAAGISVSPVPPGTTGRESIPISLGY